MPKPLTRTQLSWLTVLAAVSAIDKARAKGVLKKNTASRKISRLAKHANKAV